MVETLANGYSSKSSQHKLSNEYQHDRVLTVFKNVWVLVLLMKVRMSGECLENVWPCYVLRGRRFREEFMEVFCCNFVKHKGNVKGTNMNMCINCTVKRPDSMAQWQDFRPEC